MARNREPSLPPLPELLRAAGRSAALGVLKQYGGEIDRTTARRVGSLIAALLRPRSRPGRPRSESVQVGLELRGQGKPWHEVYRKAIADFDRLNYHEQRHKADNLRKAIRAAKKSKVESVPAKNS